MNTSNLMKQQAARIKVPANIPPGSPYPLGATWDGKGVNFALTEVTSSDNTVYKANQTIKVAERCIVLLQHHINSQEQLPLKRLSDEASI